MDNKEKINETLIKIASQVFSVDQDNIKVNSSKENYSEWDSLAHLKLMIAIESKFFIKFSTDEILDINSLSDINNLIITKNSPKLT